ncbi:MAG: hypothetical protein JRF54_02955 [Deltaproteobacteria bacterium]|nr:hypothetical protein [Deltaproteobacteria bacterium]MBW2545737.1 hypothetical protein [Deltaproteobacteria bacterium]MBW2717593.1 hypothetical protein [Deltaproteobacteria bacterium]
MSAENGRDTFVHVPMRTFVNHDVSELMFRLLFSSIFVVLGAEHLFHDDLIQQLMPEWLPMKRAFSVASGVILLLGGASIALGVRVSLSHSAPELRRTPYLSTFSDLRQGV